jgi:DNA-binding NarL/FixJ family response regulator
MPAAYGAGAVDVPPVPLRVLMVDDHPIVLAGMKALVTADPRLEVVGEARDGRTALRLARQLRPDAIVLDIGMPGPSGVDVAAELRTALPQTQLIILTVHEDRGYLLQLLEVGVSAYLLKRSAGEELVRAIHAVTAGGLYLDPAIAGKVIGTAPRKEPIGSLAELSERESEVLRLVAEGYSRKSIATQLSISIGTIETYKSRAREKLGLKSRVEIIHYAAVKGWLRDG